MPGGLSRGMAISAATSLVGSQGTDEVLLLPHSTLAVSRLACLYSRLPLHMFSVGPPWNGGKAPTRERPP